MERGFETFGTGITSADFQIGGTYPSLMEALKIAASGCERRKLLLLYSNAESHIAPCGV